MNDLFSTLVVLYGFQFGVMQWGKTVHVECAQSATENIWTEEGQGI